MATILVADDRPINREMLATLLGYFGHRIVYAGDGAEALERARGERPDLVITDILMQNMDGGEFARRLAAEPSLASIPVIFYTATYNATDAKRIAEQCGVRWVLPKPSQPEAIVAAVNEALGAKAAAPQIQPEEIGARFADYLGSLQDLHLRMTRLVDEGKKLTVERDRLQRLASDLEQSMGAFQSISLRLTALVEHGIQLASMRSVRELLELSVGAAQHVMSARCAGIGVLDESGRLREFVVRGLDEETRRRMRLPDPASGFLAPLVAERRACRMQDLSEDCQPVGMPEGHPPLANFLAVPVATADKVVGFLCLGDKLGGAPFSEDDQRISTTLASQLALAYQNLVLDEQVRANAAQLEQRVDERTRELREANAELDAFAHSVSHDLRAPLRHVQGFAQLLQRRSAASSDSGCAEHAQKIVAAAGRMDRLIDDLLELSHTSRKPLDSAPVDLERLAADVCAELVAQETGRDVAWRVGEIAPVRGDAGLLRIALANLLANALKFTRRQPHARIEIDAGAGEREIVLRVRDNGAGFPMDQAHRLFAPFQRLHAEKEFEGNGIGLATVQRIARKHGGRAWAESEPGRGATFYVALPAAAPAQKAAA